jgi:hypothetical protein
MTTNVFISYRREDTASFAGRLHDRLVPVFGRDAVFMDVDAIPLGVDFVKVIDNEVAKCDVLLAIVGPGWVRARDDDGGLRLDNSDDFVRIEIAAALKRDIQIIPILVDGARIPKAHELPDDIKGLATRNGLDIRNSSFHSDMDKLIRELRGQKSSEPPETGKDHDLHDHKRRVELAEEVLADFHQFADIVRAIRLPGGPKGESAARVRTENETPKESSKLDAYFIPIARIKQHSDFFLGLRSKRYRSRVLHRSRRSRDS